ncbi:MAG: putative sulfoacetate transporter SauU [Acidobacteriota bacterium]
MPTHSSSARATPTGEPTRTRTVVLWFAIVLAIITYVDRVCISQAAPQMQKDLGLTKEQMGWAFTAFSLAYALFEIPGGWLGDKIGPRKVLMRVVSMWSIFTVATGWAWSLGSLVLFRFLFGIGEAGCFPNVTKAFTLWFPAIERVKAQGVMWLSARWGGAFTPLLVGWMLATGGEGKSGLGLHYKWVFLIFGVMGVLWAVLFYRWFRDLPKNHPKVNAAELAIIGDHSHATGGDHSVPWAELLAARSVWMLWLQYFCMSFAWYFYITWMPTFIKETFPNFTDIQRALLGCVPLFFGGLGSIFAGLVAAPLERYFGSSATTRRFLGCAGLCMAAVMLLASIYLRQTPAAALAGSWIPILSMLAVGMASFCNDLAMPGAWGACMEVGGKHTGSLSGSMNMMGNLGGAMPGFVVPMVLTLTNAPGATTPNWNSVFYLFAAVYVVGGLSWLAIDAVTPLAQQAAKTRSSGWAITLRMVGGLSLFALLTGLIVMAGSPTPSPAGRQMALVGGGLMTGCFFLAFLVDCLTEMRDSLRKLTER